MNSKRRTAIILLVLALIAGLATWYLYSQVDDEPATDQQTEASTSEPAESDEPAEPTIQTYQNDELGISFVYPATWQTLVCDDADDTAPTTVYLASDDRGLGIQDDGQSILCGPGSDFSPQAAIFSIEGADTPSGTPETVEVDGVEASKYTIVDSGEDGFRPEGFTTVIYIIPQEGGSELRAVYSKWPASVEGYDTSDESLEIFENLVENDLELET